MRFQAKGYGLLLCRTPLTDKIWQYRFFSYKVNEVSHLGDTGYEVVINYMTKIRTEVESPSDLHRDLIIVSLLELLLNYCLRFYDCQFSTRKVFDRDIFMYFEYFLNDYFQSELPQKLGLFCVAYFAEKLHFSANYFGD
ncbi:hypothetical protein [Riemerella columbipharyngis]|uniref:Uncharacterized protein n=1 Tax=Riemerella columbipharyngis TaxID=1071918 RepID=A0A1G7E624_9FLAO|nr:hypothetical protein [Riemerella columbipharyngis]SDE59168.1 hypothetical protein SAMN05421544_11435 [Riemerella columbipharyngis]